MALFPAHVPDFAADFSPASGLAHGCSSFDERLDR
jgi:hypothetical protein